MLSRRLSIAGLNILSLKRVRPFPPRTIVTAPSAEFLPPDSVIDEEKIPGNNLKHYYPANPGDILENKYELHAKVGWGTTSTVWLAEDIRRRLLSKRYVAIKICNCDTSEEDMTHELDMNKHLDSADPDFQGRAVLTTAIEAYEIDSPRGQKHLALVFEPLREPLWLLRRRLAKEDRTPIEWLHLMKVYTRILLDGLDYMHSKAQVIHTDLKLDNIMVHFEDSSSIERFIKGQPAQTMSRKKVGDYTVYRCHNDFGPILNNMGNVIPQITDFGLSQRGDKTTEPLIHPIQPDGLRAPEVLFGIGWSYSADIWNFGCMVWELLDGKYLFSQSTTRPYSATQHLADMIALIGPIPPSLIERERKMRHWRWRPEGYNPSGKLCSNAAEFYDGPFFTDDGNFVADELIPFSRSLGDEVPQCIIDEGRVDEFLAFMRRMLCWVPEERASAAELAKDPWLEEPKRLPCTSPEILKGTISVKAVLL